MASTAGTAAAVDAITSPSVDARAVDSPVDATASSTVAAITGPTVDAIPSTAVVAIRCPAMDSSAGASAVDPSATDSPMDSTADGSPMDTCHFLATSAISGIVAFAVPDTALIAEGD